jgi:hypothetical protein
VARVRGYRLDPAAAERVISPRDGQDGKRWCGHVAARGLAHRSAGAASRPRRTWGAKGAGAGRGGAGSRGPPGRAVTATATLGALCSASRGDRGRGLALDESVTHYWSAFTTLVLRAVVNRDSALAARHSASPPFRPTAAASTDATTTTPRCHRRRRRRCPPNPSTAAAPTTAAQRLRHTSEWRPQRPRDQRRSAPVWVPLPHRPPARLVLSSLRGVDIRAGRRPRGGGRDGVREGISIPTSDFTRGDG